MALPSIRCPYCGAYASPLAESKVTGSGWILFVVLLVICCVASPLALLLRETTSRCSRCLQVLSKG